MIKDLDCKSLKINTLSLLLIGKKRFNTYYCLFFVELDWLNNTSFLTGDALSLHNRYLETTENVWTKKEQRYI